MKYIHRELEDEIIKYLNSPEIIAVLGPRQSGKTTMINNILDNLQKTSKRINRISFDNRKILALFEEDIDSFIDLHIKDYDILFIDEVHYSKDSGKKLKFIYDSNKIKIIVTGSSAPEISIQSMKYLVGRIFLFNLLPFSFEEFLLAKNKKMIKIFKEGKYKDEIIRELHNYLNEFILYGGYPRVVLANSTEEKNKVLESIFDTYLLKEIKDIFELSEDYQIINLIKSLSLNIGNLINYNQLMQISKCDYYQLKRFLNLLEKTFIAQMIKPFYTHKNRELVKNPKPYFIDLGFRNISIDNFTKERVDLGFMYENLIFSELYKNKINPKFWNTKSKAEVDFILEIKGSLIPIEIKSQLSDRKITKSLASFISKYKPKKGYVLSAYFEDKIKINGCIVNFLPFTKFISNIRNIS